MGEFNGIGEEQSGEVYTRALREQLMEVSELLRQERGRHKALKQWLFENGHAAEWLEEVNGEKIAESEILGALGGFVKEFLED